MVPVEFFRHERAQAGRYRQFWQVGVEVLGSESPAVDAEGIVLLATLLEQLGVRGTRLRLSSLGNPETRHDYRERLQAHLRAHADELSEEVRARIDLNPLRAFDSEHPGTRAVMADAPRLLDALEPDDAAHFAEVRALLDAVEVPYEVDPTLVRGLDYYSRTVFEVTSDALGAQSGVGGGGRYDRLVGLLGGPDTPGFGWAAGIERVLLAGTVIPTAPAPVDLYVAVGDPEPSPPGGAPGSRPNPASTAFRILRDARVAGLSAQMELAGRSAKGVMRQAERIGSRYVAVVGEHDTELRDLEDGRTTTLPNETVVHAVLRGRRDL